MELHMEWQLLRAAADEDASPINLTSEGDFDQKVSGAIEIKSDAGGIVGVNNMFIALAAGAAENKTLTWRLFNWAKFNGMAQQVAYGTGKTGSQAVVKYPNAATATNIFWCDDLSVTEYSWPTPVEATVGGENNSVAMLSLRILGSTWWFMQIEDADGATGAEAGDVSVWWKRR